MGWLKKAAKWVAKKAKAVVRLIVRVVVTLVGLAVGLPDVLLGFAAWPPKRLRVHVVILSDDTGPVIKGDQLTQLNNAIAFARRTFKDRLNVDLRSYAQNMIETMDVPAPKAALDVGCDAAAVGDEFGDAGEFFAQHLAGWNAIPVSVTFPITVFIVRSVVGKQGCSLGFATDYITVDPDGVANPSLMAHEIGHACNILKHSGTKSNLMYADYDRGDGVKWFQKNIFRSSRHVTYW